MDLYSLDHIILSASRFYRTPGAFYPSFPLQALAPRAFLLYGYLSNRPFLPL